MKASLRTSAIAAVLLLVASAGYPQNFPAKPIRIIAPAAGGGIDFVARVVASALSAYLGQQVVVEGSGGGGGRHCAGCRSDHQGGNGEVGHSGEGVGNPRRLKTAAGSSMLSHFFAQAGIV